MSGVQSHMAAGVGRVPRFVHLQDVIDEAIAVHVDQFVQRFTLVRFADSGALHVAPIDGGSEPRAGVETYAEVVA